MFARLKSWLDHGAERKAQAQREEALRQAYEERNDAYALYRDAVARRDSRAQHVAHQILKARVNVVLKLEGAR